MKISLKLTALVAFLIASLLLPSCVGGTAPALGWSGGVLEGNELFFGSRDGTLVEVNVTEKTKEWAVSLETGRAPSGLLGCSSVPITIAIYGTPVVSDNLVYVGGYNGRIYAFAAGKDKPRKYPSDTTTIKSIVGGVALANGRVFFGSSDGNVYAIPTAGSFEAWAEEWNALWKFQTGGKVWATPVVNEDTVYIGSFNHKLYALDAASGTKKWEFKTTGVIMATPVVEDGVVYIGSFDRYLYAIDADNGQLKWSYKARDGFWATPIIHDNVVYAPSLDGKVHVLAAGNGQELAEINLNAPVSSSPVLVGNSVIVSTQESKANSTQKKGATLWTIDTTSYKAKELARLVGDRVHASLTSGEGSVYVHTDKDLLYAVDITTGAILQFSAQ